MINQEDKEVLARAIAYYYENYVWESLLSKDFEEDSDEASDEDYRLRQVTKKLELDLPVEILQRL